MHAKFIRIFFLLLISFYLFPSQALAVPSFARQTGMDCAACHIAFPELTPFGREFKLNGYTLGERQWFPFAAMMQFSATNIAKNHDNTGAKQMPHDNDPQFDVLSIFAAGKLNDHGGMFVQWTYDNNGDQNNAGAIRSHSGLDNTDIRFVLNHDLNDKSLVLGVNLNNNPTVQDVWNSTPAWGFPYSGPNLPHPEPAFATVIDGGLGQQVAGLGAYFWYDRHLYGEFSLYGSANGFWRPLSAGQAWNKQDGVTRINGRNNPYWRLAWNEDWGAHSLMVGTYGMVVDEYPDNLNPSGPTNRFTDTALDAQYQYLSDPHIFTVQTSYIHEKQHYKASFDPTCSGVDGACNRHDNLNTFKIKGSYLYDRKYGATVAYFNTTGSNDAGAFNTGDNPVTKPNNEGYIAQLDYNPWTFAHLTLQYIGYTVWDGSRQVDGLGLKPRDRNTLYLGTWFAF